MTRFDPARASALIRAARADAGLTQRALAERVGLAQPSLAQMEAGTRSPSMRNIAAHGGYVVMDDDVLWRALTERLPEIVRRLLGEP